VMGIEQSRAPYPLLWFLRVDGQVNACTYMPEQEVIGWHPHETDGRVLDICVLPGDDEDEVYFLVERDIDGQAVQYIEQLAEFRVLDQRECVYMHSAQTYDGRNTGSTTISLTGSATWE